MFTTRRICINREEKEVIIVSLIEYIDSDGNFVSDSGHASEIHYEFCESLTDGAKIFLADVYEDHHGEWSLCSLDNPDKITAIGTLEFYTDENGVVTIKKNIDQDTVKNRWKPVPVKIRDKEAVSGEELKQYISGCVNKEMSWVTRRAEYYLGSGSEEINAERTAEYYIANWFACRYILDGIKNNKFSYSQLVQLAKQWRIPRSLISDSFCEKILEYFTTMLNGLK